jgi:hypothetical protein
MTEEHMHIQAMLAILFMVKYLWMKVGATDLLPQYGSLLTLQLHSF